MTFTFENYFQIFIDTCSFSHFFVTGYNRSDPNLKYIIIMMYNTSKMYLVLWTVLLFFFHVKLIFLLGFFINELWRSLKTIFMVITCQTKFHNAVLFSNFTYLLNKAFTYNFYKFERKRTGSFICRSCSGHFRGTFYPLKHQNGSPDMVCGCQSGPR